MTASTETYSASCHRGAVLSRYLAPEDFEAIEGRTYLSLYQFGDKDINHYFCSKCGIAPFIAVAGVPGSYDGPAKLSYYRVNLGCVHGLDVLGLNIDIIDGQPI